MNDSAKAKKNTESKKAPSFPKLLCLLLLLLAVASVILALFSYKEKKESAALADYLEETALYVKDIAGLNRQRLQASNQELKDINIELENEVGAVNSRFKFASSASPLHLSETYKPLSKTGLFDGVYQTNFTTVKTHWNEVGEQLLTSKIINGSNKNFAILTPIEDKLNVVILHLETLTEKIKAGNKVLESIMMFAGIMLIGLLTLILITVLSYLMKLNKKNKRNHEEPKDLKPEMLTLKKDTREPTSSLAADAPSIKEVTPENLYVSSDADIKEEVVKKMEPKKMNDREQEISRLKTLLETLFNDQFRPLCIADVDGDILMENEAFKAMSKVDSSETTLPQILESLLPAAQSQKFKETFVAFFSAESQGQVAPLDGVKIKGRDTTHRVTLQPFHTQDNELCSLIAIQEMGQPKAAPVITDLDVIKPSSEDNAITPKEVSAEQSVVDEIKGKTAAVGDVLKTGLGSLGGLTGVVVKDDNIAPKQAPESLKKTDPFSAIDTQPQSKVEKVTHNLVDPFDEGASSFAILPVITDLSEKLASVNGKKVSINTENFDEAIIPEKLQPVILDTLGQALKFSIPHSVETEESRVAAGKDAKAHIILSNKFEKTVPGLDKPGIVFYYKDDGKGVDPSVVLATARSAKLTNKKTPEELTKNEILSFLFNKKFTLPKQHALDVENLVKLKETVVKDLKGKMRLSYQEGESFSFQLLVPTEKGK